MDKGKVLVSDFDGTMTRHDFYELVIELLLPPDEPDYWAAYRARKITHFEALRRYFADIRSSEDEVLKVVEQMGLDPQLPTAVESLREAGWRIVVASAGCDWYIRRLLAPVGVELEIHANPGQFEAGRGLIMKMPTESPYWSPNFGIDKTGVVQDFLNQGLTVAFAGDGFPDAEPARIVPANSRFARGELAVVLQRERLAFHPFQMWSEVAHRLVQIGA